MKTTKISKDQLFELIKKVTEEAANATGTGATFTPGAGEQYATLKAFKKKVKESNTSAPFEKGFKHGTHPGSKAMDYKQLYEDVEGLEIGDKVQVIANSQFSGETGTVVNIQRGFAVVEMDRDGRQYSMHISDVEKLEDDDDYSDDGQPVSDYGRHRQDPNYYEKNYREKGTSDYFQRRSLDELDINDPVLMAMRAKKDAPTPQVKKANPNQAKINALLKKRAEIEREMEQEAEPAGGPIADKYAMDLMRIDAAIKKLRRPVGVQEETLAEGYAQFKNETKTRSKPEQFHQAVKAVKKRVQEINKLFEYVSKLKTELSEDKDGLKYKAHTEKAIGQIKEMVMNLNKNIRKFK